jgi:hypothetical protein
VVLRGRWRRGSTPAGPVPAGHGDRHGGPGGPGLDEEVQGLHGAGDPAVLLTPGGHEVVPDDGRGHAPGLGRLGEGVQRLRRAS